MKKQLLFFIGLSLSLSLSIILQAQVSETVTLSSPGTLGTAVQSYKNTVTNLTITGVLDARDFLILRDSMANLSFLDISNASIVSYSGSGGTHYPGFYNANTIPNSAFYAVNTATAKTSLTSIILPKTINSIGMFAFLYCTGLTSVTMPAQLSYIDDDAFSGCSNLSSFTIPSSVTSIGSYAFEGCQWIDVASNNPYFSSVDGVLFDKHQKELLQCSNSKTSYVIPSTVDSLAWGAFGSCSKLTSITIPSTIKTIPAVTFTDCTALDSIIIPSSITTIGPQSFFNCNSLKSITIPATVKKIESAVFVKCTYLQSIYAYSKIPIDLSSSSCVFQLVDTTNCILYVPFGSKSAYQNAVQWKSFNNIVEMSGISVSNSAVTMTDSASIAVISNTTWIASSNKTWLSVSPDTASIGNKVLTFSATPNPTISTRTAVVTIASSGISSQTITITQLAGKATVTVSNTDVTIAKDSGSTVTDSITSNTTWTAISNKSWLTVNPSISTSGDALLTMSAIANTTNKTRTAIVTIWATNVSTQTITITQASDAGIADISTMYTDNFILYPNPNRGNFAINITGKAQMQVYNTDGVLLINKLIVENELVSICDLPSGLYFVKIITEKKIVTSRLIIE